MYFVFLPFLWDCGPKLPRQPSIIAKVSFGDAWAYVYVVYIIIVKVDMPIG